MASTLLPEIDVEVVKITLTKKDNSGTTTVYFGLDYWPAGTIYTTNAETYPLLATSPTVRRGVGVYAGIRYDVSIDIYAKTTMSESGKSFFDLLDLYELHNADCQVLYYSKPIGAVTTHSDSVNIRQTLKVIDVRYSDDGSIATLRCRDSFFKDKEVSKKINFGTNSWYNKKSDGQYGSIVFGQSTDTTAGIIIDAPIYTSRLIFAPGPAAYFPGLSIFAGFDFTNHPYAACRQVYVKNQHKKLDGTDWLKLDTSSDGVTTYAGNTSVAGGVNASLQTNWRGVAYSPGSSKAIICSVVQIYLEEAGTVAAGDGTASIEISFGETTGGVLPWTPTGSVLRSPKIDGDNAIFNAGKQCLFEIIPPLVLNNAESYFFSVKWSNLNDAANYIRTKIVVDASYSHFYQDKSETERAWATGAGVRLPIGIYALGAAGTGFGFASTGGGIVSFGLAGPYGTYDSSTGASGQPALLDNGLEFKIGVSGIKDDGSGTYTGSASAVIENPSDIIRFTLMNSEFGLGLTSTYVDTSTLDSVRTSLTTAALMPKIVINRETSAEDLINEICRQCRIVYYKTKAGKIALYYPVPINNTFTAQLSQAFMGGELFLASVQDNEYSTVVNEFRQYYNRDEINQPTDPAVVRRSELEKLAGKLEITPTSSTGSDTFRQNLCSVSQAKYGKREMTADLSFYDDATPAQTVQNYYCDRYSTLQKRGIIKVPRRTFHNTLDLFSTLRISHVGIPAADGTGLPGRTHYQGAPIITYSDGIPSVVWSGGVLEGQVYEVEEQGPWMTLTAETVSVF